MENINWEKPFGIAILDWGITAGLIIASIIGAKIIFWILSKIISKLTSKTKTKLDDLLLDSLEEPLALVLGAIGVWKSIDWLGLSAVSQGRIDKILFVVLLGFIAWAITRTIEALIDHYLVPVIEKSESDLDDQLLPILRKALKVTVWIMAIIIGFNNAGYDVGAIVAGLGIGGLAFALAAQDSVKNLFGGFTIFIDKPFTIRDRIKISGFDGSVEEIGIRSTRIRTLDGRMVTIPNSKFSESAIENISSEPSRKVALNLGLTYGTSSAGVKEAMELLKGIVKSKNVVPDKVFVGFNAFNDSSLNIICVYYISPGADILGVQTEINLEILENFANAKLEFAFPTQTLFIEKDI
ncbi:MAG: mechanosensitive ion channel family protein [Flavobacteriales bacterium]|nr:mechanosensitive ion channel family protein [Flavobacteriales bacterium]